MKFALIALISVSSISFAANKISISEMKSAIQLYEAAGISCKANLEKLNAQSKCEDLRVFLQECNIVALDSNGQKTDVANVVQCEQ
jgi:hypothetical protein